MSKFIKSGNTIVELALYMALLAIFLVPLFNTFATIISVQTRSTAVSLIQTNSNYLLTKLAYDISQADSITTPVSIGSTSSFLTLKNNSVTSTYNLNNGYLQLTDGSGTYNLNDIDTAITNLVFTRLGNAGGRNSIELSFTLNSLVVDNSDIKTVDLRTIVSLR